ncbi:cysteine desulfurase family protein [Parasporobacterium paucivorans]|uniref:Cysteine desulfurase n=1 Tax=Parasporobacterium paucivorans DSM 15970 TaxID=1122934 RepID=A0A1M6C164_9FIRM|nr:cysteine desulfurase family protein [Parasporobacterium paucivorans]SHI54601.1 cysteine desulfurase [Parasporobacterium paucivorans DSM 15970]
MEAYLDNSATTQVFENVTEIMTRVMHVHYGNPSSLHAKGLEAEKYIKTAKGIMAGQLKVREKEIFFTSGGTESNNLAVIGTAMANKRAGNHIITTRIEHPSVLNACKFLEEEGFEVTYLPVDKNGVVLLDKLEEAVTDNTILVSIMYVNNEIGSLQPFSEISEIIRRKNPKTVIHSDAVQAFGKCRIFPQKEGIDLLSASAHKLHGPKGAGMLYVNSRIKIKPLFYGGNQQDGLRSGTENVPGIAGFGEAVKMAYDNLDEKTQRLSQMKRDFISHLEKLEDVTVFSKNEGCFAPHIISAGFAGVKSEVLLHALEEKEIYVSSGSACNSHKKASSATLQAIGVPKDLLDNTLRFSLSYETAEEELDYTIETLTQLLPKLRLYRKR